MKAVLSFVIFLLGIGVGALAEDSVVEFEPVDLASTLPGTAYFLSRGPNIEAEVSSDLGVIIVEQNRYAVERSRTPR